MPLQNRPNGVLWQAALEGGSMLGLSRLCEPIPDRRREIDRHFRNSTPFTVQNEFL